MGEHRFPYRWRLADLPAPEPGAPRVFGTFLCGGGSTMGYKLAGFDHLGGVEIDPRIASIYAANHHPRHLFVEDLRIFNRRNDLPAELHDIDILDGSPPCSTFSLAGQREKAWGRKKTFREGQSRQTLDDLVFVYCDTIAKLRPKVAILENVAGLIKGNARNYCHRINDRLFSAGYEVQVFLLNAAKMGVPQTRQRTFFIARRRDLGFEPLSLCVNEPPIPFREIADRLPSAETLSYREYELWRKRRPSDMGLDDIAKRVLGKGSYFNTRLVHADRVAPTICAANYNILYDAPRRMTSTELRLAGSFPLDYSCGASKLGFIVGMSVAPVQMAHIASAIKSQWFTKGGSPCSRNAL